jgi:hypothetical protein
MAVGTLTAIALALTAVATGVGTYASVAQGSAAKEAGKNQQRSENANAKAAQDAAALEAGQIRRKNLLRMGSQRANAAKSGVLVDDSAADVIYDSSIQGELEALSSLYSGASAASYARSRGRNAAWEGKQAAKAGYIGAGSSVIGGLNSGVNTFSTAKFKT